MIDQARGMVMVLAPCSSERAWDLLVEVSQHCNVKLRDVAAALVATTKDETLPEQVRRELRRALRRLHAANRGDGVRVHRPAPGAVSSAPRPSDPSVGSGDRTADALFEHRLFGKPFGVLPTRKARPWGAALAAPLYAVVRHPTVIDLTHLEAVHGRRLGAEWVRTPDRRGLRSRR